MNNPRRIQRHLVRALAAGALLAAAALPLAIASAAGAATADSISSITFDGNGVSLPYVGTGASGTFVLLGNFADDGGNVTVTSSAPGLTFSSLTDGSTVTGDFATTSATVAGTYSVTVTDDNGTATDSTGVTVNADPTVSSLATTSAADNGSSTTPTSVSEVITGSGFFTTSSTYGSVAPTVTFTSTVNGTTLDTTATSTSGTQSAPSGTLDATVKLYNTSSTNQATPGTYTVTVTNADGGSYTSSALFTVSGDDITAVSPSEIAEAAGTYSITVSGDGFQSGAVLTVTNRTGTAGTGACPTITASDVDVTSSTTITADITSAGTSTAATCNVTVSNSGSGDNGSVAVAVNGLGVGTSGLLSPVITGSSLTSATALEAGASAVAITFTGEGFNASTAPVTDTTIGTSTTPDLDAVLESGCIGGSTGTSITCELDVTGGATAGEHGVSLTNGGTVGSFDDAFTVAGPAITSLSPTSIAVGAAIGTTVAITGTGFSNTSSLSVETSGKVATPSTGHDLTGTGQYVSATSMNFVVTGSPTSADNGDLLFVTTTDSDGYAEVSAPATISVGSAPTVTSITYATDTTGVGVGATAQTITINGTGFTTGATVGTFVNASGTADADVKATVTSITTSQIVATIAIAAGDANTIDGYTVTNTNGGTITVSAVTPAGLTIDAAPTITSVTPTTGDAGATTSFAVAGTGFAADAVTTLSPANGTCGTTTVSASTTIAATCTLGQPGVTATYLVVTNLDGGSATSTTAVLAAASTAKPFHVSGVHGAAVAGKTVTVTITGTGFSGQPKITSAAGYKFAVSKDNGKVLTVRVTAKAGLHGEHTLTVHDAGHTGKAGFNTKA
jgi:hypothetical protein